MSTIASLVIIKAKSMTLYCSKEEGSVSGLLLPVISICSAARIPYSFYFVASAQQQEEDKLILSTLE